MQRGPIVIASTVAGLAFVLGFSPKGSQGSSSATSLSATTTPSDSSTNTDTSSTTDTTTPTSTKPAAPVKARPASKSATGDTVEINEFGRSYGQVAVKATVTGGKLTKVSIAKLDTYDGNSSQIASYALPILLQESVDAGSAQIDGVSGASYTSQAYETSLQSALDKLGV
jgi:uncharacterized protein with FMN-binding domain